MKNIINQTETIASNYFKEFGFSDEQISSLVIKGKKDLITNLEKLQLLLNEDTIRFEEVSNVLHALKGLFFQLGNHSVAEKISESRHEIESGKEVLETIKQLLFKQ